LTDKYRKWLPPIGTDFLTVTLNPQWYSRKACDQFKQTKDTLKHILKKFSDNFCMIAELTKQGNVHYHGWIVYRHMHETTKQHLLDTLKVLGLSHINETIKNQTRVLEYMTKHVKFTNEFINNPIVRYKKKNILLSESKVGVGGETEAVSPHPPSRSIIVNIMDDLITALDYNTINIEYEVPEGTE